MHKRPLCFQWLRGCIVNAGNGANKAGTRAESGAYATFWQRPRYMPAPLWRRGIPMKIKTSTLPAGTCVKVYLAVAATALALLAIPHAAHPQGIVRGAQQGAAEGNRVGGVVGGAVGAGVGGAMGAVKGVFGIPNGGYRRCRGYYDRYDRFHCYRR
jgi:hypothetical protein